MDPHLHQHDIEAGRAAIAALEAQRATPGDAVLGLAVAPLRARPAGLPRPPADGFQICAKVLARAGTAQQ